MIKFERDGRERRIVKEILAAALEKSCPRHATRAALRRSLEQGQFPPSVFLCGVGKAASAMAEAALEVLEPLPGSMLITKYHHSLGLRGIEEWEAAHPIPDEQGVMASRKLIDRMISLPLDTPIVVLLSGGASSLLCLPRFPLTLGNIQETTTLLLHSAVPIDQVNTVRKHLSQIAGGQLTRLVSPRPVWTFLLSDVIGNDVSSVGSGPTVVDPTSWQDVHSILTSTNLLERLPDAVQIVIQQGVSGLVEDTPKEFDNRGGIEFVGNNHIALQAAEQKAQELNLAVHTIQEPLTCEIAEAEELVLHEVGKLHESLCGSTSIGCLIIGGEITVEVKGDGKGGRNQELAARLAWALQDRFGFVVGTLATDGTDGPTEAAGGIVDNHTTSLWRKLNIDVVHTLASHDSYNLLGATGDLLFTGPTGTNVNDILVILVFPDS